MASYIIRRLLALPVILWVIYTLTFVLICQHPGNPFADEKTPKEQQPLLARQVGIIYHPDADWKTRWWDNCQTYYGFLKRLAGFENGEFSPANIGHLGWSTHYGEATVNELLAGALPRSMLLGGFALAVAVVAGCTLGIVAAVRSHGPIDYLVMVYALLGISLPLFVIGALLLMVLAFWLGLFPVGGWGTPGRLILPGLTLSLPFTAYIARLMRAGMLDVLNAAHIRTAQAKGLPASQVILKHAFKPAFLPVLSFLGPATAAILTGSFIVEKVFDVPGVGRVFVQAVQSKDYALVLGTVLVYSAVLIVANLIVDLCYTWLDPRIRLEGE